MNEAAVLKCPECGGVVTRGERRCHHCRAELLTVRCPACFQLHHAGANACAQCGQALGLEAQLGPLGIPCPRCESETLEGIQLDGNDLGECRRCGGLFVEHAILARATRAAEGRRGIRMHATEPKELPPPEATDRMYLRCPRCRELMARRNFGRVSGVIVDICRTHGTWFDKDELTHIIEFVEANGMERASSSEPVRRFPTTTGRVKPSELESYNEAGALAGAVAADIVQGVFDALFGRRRW